MTLALLSFISGTLAALFCLALASVVPAARNRIGPLLPSLASGGAVGFLWLASSHLAIRGSGFLAGFLISPLCLLPVRSMVSSRTETLARAAAGLGADRAARLRYLWVPLLRLPLAIGLSIYALCLVLFLGFAGFFHD